MDFFAVAVRDVKADGFATPFFVPTLGMAERSFADEVARDGSPMNVHPEDYSLYHVGMFNDSNGQLVSTPTPTLLVTAIATVRPKQ